MARLSGCSRWGLAVLVAMSAGIAGCGEDDDDEATGGAGATTTSVTETTAAATSTTEPAEPAGDFCEAGPEVDRTLNEGDEPDPEAIEQALQAAETSAPPELEDAVTTAAGTVRQILETQDFALFESEEMTKALTEINDYYVSDCGFEELEITARDYAFQGFPASIPAGTAVLRFTNEGTELHEAAIMRIDDPELGAEQLLELPEEEARGKVTRVGGSFAMPGQSTSATVIFDEPGTYAVFCFIPQGLTPEVAEEADAGGAEPEGPPHAVLGMTAELTVE